MIAFEVADSEAGHTLDALVRVHANVSWGDARALVKRGKVFVDGAVATEGTRRLSRGAKVEVRPNARRVDPNALTDDAIVFVDPHVVVVRKPAGISTVPYEDERGETLVDRVQRWLVKNARHAPHASLGVVHRIDKETTGLVVFARTLAAKKALANAFRVHAVERRYVALVHGVLDRPCTYRSNLVEDRGDRLRGSARDANFRGGQLAVTHVAPIEVLSAEASAVACALETGRTHQIRIHLSEAGHPLVGDRVYTRDRLRRGLPLLVAPRVMLHAAVLGFLHPTSGRPVRFAEPVPEDVLVVVKRLAGRPIDLSIERLPAFDVPG